MHLLTCAQGSSSSYRPRSRSTVPLLTCACVVQGSSSSSRHRSRPTVHLLTCARVVQGSSSSYRPRSRPTVHLLTCALVLQGSSRSRPTVHLLTCAPVLQGSSLREVKFNSSSGGCVPPLVPTPRQEAWYPGIKGCGLPCQDPHIGRQPMAGFHSFVGIMAGLSVASTAFTVVSHT